MPVAAFGWPFLLDPPGGSEARRTARTRRGCSPLLLPLVAAIVIAELNAGGIDAKAVALLGVLAAVGGRAARRSAPASAGFEPSFFLLICSAAGSSAAGFGFVLGLRSTMFASALLTGGVGPWLPFQMLAAGWVGFLRRLPARGCAGAPRSWLLAAYGLWLGLLYGALMNLWFWPFGLYGDRLSFEEGAAPAVNLPNYARYYLVTSAIWDFARGMFTFLLLILAGAPMLRALRRVSRLANFDPVARLPAPS